MSTQHRLNINTKKKRKLDEVNEVVSSVTEYKRCAILKYCDENGTGKNQLNILSIINKLQTLGISYSLIISIISITFEFYENF